MFSHSLPHKSRFPVPRTPDSTIIICTFSVYKLWWYQGRRHLLFSFHFDKNKEVKYINLLSLRDQWEINLGSFYHLYHSTYMQVIETALFLDSAAYRRFKSYFTSIGFYLYVSIIEFVYKLPNSGTCFSLFHNIWHFEITN